MAVPFRLPDYDEDTETNFNLIHRFFHELYQVLCIFLRQHFETSSELVYSGRLPGVTVRVAVRPVIPITSSENATVQWQLESNEAAVEVPLPDIVTKPDTNDPEGGTT